MLVQTRSSREQSTPQALNARWAGLPTAAAAVAAVGFVLVAGYQVLLALGIAFSGGSVEHSVWLLTEQDQNVKRASPGRINKGHKPKATQPVLVCGLLNNGGLSAYRLQMSS